MATLATARRVLPTGNLLSAEEFSTRHELLRKVLLPHAPALLLLGVLRDFAPLTTLLEVAPIVLAWALSRVPVGASTRRARLAALAVTAGFSWASIVLVHLTSGTIEAHFHFFILLGFIALYQDWLPFAWYVGFTVLSHGLGSALAPDLIFNHHAAQSNPWLWSGIHGAGVAALAVGLIIYWSNTERQQRANTSLAVRLTETSLAQAQTDLDNRQRQSTLLVNLARRNQSLLQRQLDSIERLQATEEEAGNLSELYALDHMAARMRRNAESLLVLSGVDSPRMWRQPMLLSEVLQAAAVEIEDYQRIQINVPDYVRVDGRAAADLSHLFAELMENAVTYSPPGRPVQVSAVQSVEGDVLVSVRDEGVGMTEEQLAEVRALLASKDGTATQPGERLGLTVVGRLAARHDLKVDVGVLPSGGTVSQVVLGDGVVSALEGQGEQDEASGTQGQRSRQRHVAPDEGVPAPVADGASVLVEERPAVEVAPERATTEHVEVAPERAEPARAEQPAAPAAEAPVPSQGGRRVLPKRSRGESFEAPAPVDLWSVSEDS